jgi:hypothetical protein
MLFTRERLRCSAPRGSGLHAIARLVPFPAVVLYEWRKQPQVVARADEQVIALGGLWKAGAVPREKILRTFVIITVRATPDVLDQRTGPGASPAGTLRVWASRAPVRISCHAGKPASPGDWALIALPHGAVKAPPAAPTPPPIRAPVSGFPPVRADTPAAAPAPIAPPVTARVPGLDPQALNVSKENNNIAVFMTYTSRIPSLAG